MQEPVTQDSVSQTSPDTLSRRTLLGVATGGIAGLGLTYGLVRKQRDPISPGPISITVWSWQSGTEVEALTTVASSFNASQNAIAVEILRRPDVISTAQLLHTVRNGLGPDIIIGPRNLLAERDAVGLLQDITPYLHTIETGIDLDRDFHPFAKQSVTIGERVVGIPLDSTTRILMFNLSILKDHGLDTNEWEPNNGPVTFGRLAQVAQILDLKDSSGTLKRVGFVPSFGEGSPHQYLHSWEAEYFDSQLCAFHLDSPEAFAAAEWVQNYTQEADPQQVNALLQYEQGIVAESPFLRGNIAFAIVTDHEFRNYANASLPFELGATHIPVPDTGRSSRSLVTGNALSLMAGTNYPEEAAQFLIYMMQEEVLDEYCQSIGKLSSRTTMSQELQDKLALPSFVTQTLLPSAVAPPHVPIATWFDELLEDHWFAMVEGNEDIQTELEELQADGNNALAESGLCT